MFKIHQIIKAMFSFRIQRNSELYGISVNCRKYSLRLIITGISVFLLVACNALPSPTVSSMTDTTTSSTTVSSKTDTTTSSTTAGQAPALVEEALKIMGQIGGPTQAVAVMGNKAYVGVGSRLMVLDISAPDAIFEMGSSVPLGAYIEAITIDRNTAFVAAGGAGIFIMDISDPTRPEVIGNYDTPGYAEGVTINKEYAYIADGPAGLRVADISDPAHPVEISSAYKTDFAFDVVIEGNFAYIAAAGTGLLVADITDPLQPKETGKLEMHGYAYGITASENKAYVADGWDGLHIVDISNPAQPKEIGVYSTPGWAYDVVADGNMAYVADSYSGVHILDISNAAKSTLLGSYDMPGNILNSLALSAETVCVASRNAGMSIIDTSTPSKPARIGLYSPMGYADSVAVSGSYAYVAAGPYGLRVIDISDPSYPREVGACDTEGYAVGVVAAGNYAFVISHGTDKKKQGLHVVDVSDPYHPTKTAYCESPGTPQDIVLNSNIIYIANEWGMISFDVSNPVSPVQLSFMNFAQGDGNKEWDAATWGVAVLNNTAYVTHCTLGLEILDVSKPNAPALIRNFSSFNKKFGKLGAVTVKDNFAYISDGTSIRILDISDPKNPEEADSYNLSTDIQQLCISGNTLYATDGAAGLLAVDITDPKKTELIGWQRLPGYAQGLSSFDNYVFAADGEGGLYILEDTLKPGHEQLKEFDQSTARTEDAIYKYDLQEISPALEASGKSPGGNNITLKVTSAADDGPGSLRQAIESTSGDTDGIYTITFDVKIFPPELPTTIFLSNGLGFKNGNVTIDASNAGVILDGSKAVSGTNALVIQSDYNNIKGLQIIKFPGSGIYIGGSYNIIGGDKSKGKSPSGEGNMVSGNNFAGILIMGSKPEMLPPSNNKVIGNLIGTDISGNQAFGNGFGVFIGSGAACNIIGGQLEADRNIISGNDVKEVYFVRGANRNKITGNYIGTNAGGNILLGNAVIGISIELGGYNNIIEGNVINNNNLACVMLSDWGSWGNSVIGNIIGLDSTGSASLGGKGQGIAVNVSFNRIGGSKPEEKNIISGTGGWGIKIGLSGTTDTIVIGNYIGTDVTGTKALGNNKDGIILYVGQCNHTIIGGASDSEQNVICGNNGDGIKFEGVGNDYNFIIGNCIGTDLSGTLDLANLNAGISIDNADHTYIQNNMLAYNKKFGIMIMSGDNNRICYNDMLAGCMGYDESKNCLWDDGKEGNYWSSYGEQDNNGDGIGDKAYPVSPKSPNGTDNYPMMKPFVDRKKGNE